MSDYSSDAKAAPEPFAVKHYSADDRPSIKGNGFDGLEIGEDREEAERFIAFVNEQVRELKELRERCEQQRKALTPREWTAEMHRTWHLSIPDTEMAFRKLLEASQCSPS